MGRSESKQVVNQGTAQSTQDQANAQAALAATNKSTADYSKNLDSFMKFGRSVYGAGGEFQRDQNTLANTTAAAGQNNLTSNLALNAMRTGENTAGVAGTVAESQRQSSRDLTNQLATADASRLQQLTAVNQYGVQASALPAQVQAGLYGAGTSGATGQLDAAGGAAKTPGFWDTLAPALVGGAATVGAAFCSCAGSMVRMADDSLKPVEELQEGDNVWPMGWSTPPNPVLKTPTAVRQHCFELVTSTGMRHRGSKTHAVALACGGYGLMPELKGQSILCEKVSDVVTEVIDIGEQEVYPLALGGSHCYQADGIWLIS